eukprot:ctg_379.g188
MSAHPPHRHATPPVADAHSPRHRCRSAAPGRRARGCGICAATLAPAPRSPHPPRSAVDRCKRSPAPSCCRRAADTPSSVPRRRRPGTQSATPWSAGRTPPPARWSPAPVSTPAAARATAPPRRNRKR